MKSLSFFAIISCFLNVPLTWSFSYTKLKPSEVTFYRNEVTIHSSFAQNRQICYDKFNSRLNYVMTEIKNNTNSCVNAGDLKYQISEKGKLLQDLTEKCAMEPNIVKYFTCIKSIKADSKKILDEIPFIKEKFSKNVEKIEQNKTSCFIEAFERAKYKSNSAQYDLSLCLQNIQPQLTLPITPSKPNETEYPSKDNEEFLKYLDRIQFMYTSLNNCILYDADYNLCWNQIAEEEASENPKLRIYLIEHSSDYFEKLTEIDKADNSCLRQLVIMYTTMSFKFDLEGCIMHGYSTIIQSEENEDKDIHLINTIKKIHNSLNACRVINKDLNTMPCLFNKFSSNNLLHSEIESEISIKSEKNLKKLTEIIEDLYTQQWPCIGYMFSAFQFNGFNLKPIDKGRLMDCLLKGHKSSSSSILTKDDILSDLNKIQDVIKKCILHPDSPGSNKCIHNTVKVYQGNLQYIITTKLHNYKELVDESDKTNHTCFKSIIDNYLVFQDSYLTQLENCIINKPSQLNK